MSLEFNTRIPFLLKAYYFLYEKGKTYDTYTNAYTSQVYRKPPQNRINNTYYLLAPQTGAQLTKNQKNQISKRYKLELFLIQNLQEKDYNQYCKGVEKWGSLDFTISKADISSYLQKLSLNLELELKLSSLFSRYIDLLYNTRYDLKVTLISKLNNYSKLVDAFQSFNYKKKGIQFYIELDSKQQQEKTAYVLKERLEKIAQEEISKLDDADNVEDLFMCLIEPFQAP